MISYYSPIYYPGYIKVREIRQADYPSECQVKHVAVNFNLFWLNKLVQLSMCATSSAQQSSEVYVLCHIRCPTVVYLQTPDLNVWVMC